MLISVAKFVLVFCAALSLLAAAYFAVLMTYYWTDNSVILVSGPPYDVPLARGNQFFRIFTAVFASFFLILSAVLSWVSFKFRKKQV